MKALRYQGKRKTKLQQHAWGGGHREGELIKAECEGEGQGKVLLFVRSLEQVGFQYSEECGWAVNEEPTACAKVPGRSERPGGAVGKVGGEDRHRNLRRHSVWKIWSRF